jgi:S1-C subfamily serine protease
MGKRSILNWGKFPRNYLYRILSFGGNLKLILPLLAVFLSGCYNFQKDIIKLEPGDSKAKVLEIMGDPDDLQNNGELEVWQYYGVYVYGNCDYRQIWFSSGRFLGTTSYRSPCVFGCSPCVRPIDFSRPPGSIIVAKEPNIRLPEVSGSKNKTGSCFAVSSDGHIITAQHIIDGFNSIRIKLSGGEKFYDAKVLKISRFNDLALLKIDAKTPNWLPMISSNKITIGTPIFTIGYPVHSLGSGPMFTEGSVSSVSSITGEDAFMQISAPIQPGNSGGPVVTFNGSVIGIVTSTEAIKTSLNFTGSLPQNLNWAIKSNYAMILFEQQEKPNLLDTRERAINTVKDSICLIEATTK